MEGLSPLQSVTSNPNPSASQGLPDEESKHAQEEQLKRDLVSTVLDPAARERLSRISLVSPERSKHIESILLRMAQSGQLRGRISENQLIELLEQEVDYSGALSGLSNDIFY
ncbi:hypothetical protein C0992_005726 [Termitomyces sp. T32_za158]|nr:hypothetical protein C0992_005726 [Termitomyces sp. T32_za158]